MNLDASIGTDAETLLVEDPVDGRPSGSASLVDRRDLGFAQTAVSGHQGPTNDSLISGATLRGEGLRAEASVPARIGRFLVLGRLGSGGMGVVVEAYDPELDRKVAIKLLKSGRARSDSQARLLREAQAMARLSHPNVVQVYDVGLVGEQVFVAMELVVGKNLAQWLAERPRPWREVVALFIAAGRGLAAAHAAGLVHRDFKPDNVLIADDGRVRVADFGLAREDRAALTEASADDGADERPLLANTLTATGVLMGTPMYMSPEQHLAEPVGPRSDIFSFSVALFEALYGARPFAGETMAQLARNVRHGNVVATKDRRGVPAWLDSAVRRGLAVEIEARYPSFDEYLLAIDRDPSRARRRWLGAGALGLVGALAGGAIHASGAGTPSCTAGAQALAEVWNDDAEAQLRQRLEILPEGARAAIEPRLLRGLSDYAADWRELDRQACVGHQQGDRSDALFDAQERCLDRRRAALGGAIELLRDADVATLQEATMVVAKLPPVAYCGDRDALLAEVAPPESAAAMAVVAELRDRLTQAELLASASRTGEALRDLAELRTEVQATGYVPLFAEYSLVEGRVLLDAQEGPRALAALEEAFLRATEAGADAVATEARARSFYVRGIMLGDPEVLKDRPHLEALGAHSARRDLAALIANNTGAVLAATGDPTAARDLFRSAVELAKDDPLTRPIDYAAGYLKNLALLSDQEDERERLLAKVASMLDETLSPLHPASINLRLTQGMLSPDPATARELLQPACPLLSTERDERLNRHCVECYHRLGHVEDELGHDDAAAAAMTAGLACLEGPIAEEDREVVQAWQALIRGQRSLYQGENDAAGPDLAEARRLMEPHREAWWIALLLADVELTDGRRLANTDPSAAIPHLEAAIAGFEPLREQAFDLLPSYGLARAQVSLAEALIAEVEDNGLDRDAVADAGANTGAEPPPPLDARDLATRTRRAETLLDAAETYYKGAGPSYAERLAELNAWRVSHIR